MNIIYDLLNNKLLLKAFARFSEKTTSLGLTQQNRIGIMADVETTKQKKNTLEYNFSQLNIRTIILC